MNLLKCEYLKTRRRYIFITALAITAFAGIWAFYGNYSGDIKDFVIQNGYLLFLYQFPLMNAIFFPLLCIIIASRLCDIEHKGKNLKLICTLTEKSKIFDAKLIYGISIVIFCVILLWCATLIFGKIIGFAGKIPINLYLLYLLFTIISTTAIYVFQYSLSMIFQNQAISFFVGILGEFIGLFSMFLPQFPLFRKSILWGYYGALQFVGLFGYTKETRYDAAYMEVMDIDWTAFIVLIVAMTVIYIIGKKIFCKKEL